LVRFITDLFDRFSRASGLKINLSKSRAFYFTSTLQAKINRLTSIFGIRSIASLDKYLGFPILKGRAKHNDFLLIIEKMQSRLAYWKNKLLNKPGRLTLVSYVLSPITSTTCRLIGFLIIFVIALVKPHVISFKGMPTTKAFIW